MTKLKELVDYCRIDKIIPRDGYLNVYYHCEADTAKYDTVESCNNCLKHGCHIHTAAMDAEKLLNNDD